MASKYNGNYDLKRDNFDNDNDYQEYTSDRDTAQEVSKALEESISIEKEIQTAIDDFRDTDRNNFDLVNELTFTDSDGVEHKIDIYVESGEASINGGAVTKPNFFKNTDGSYKSIKSIKIVLDFQYLKTVGSKLAHEGGHAFNIAKNPIRAMEDKGSSTHNCQDPSYRNHFRSKTAMDWQESFEKKKKN